MSYNKLWVGPNQRYILLDRSQAMFLGDTLTPKGLF